LLREAGRPSTAIRFGVLDECWRQTSAALPSGGDRAMQWRVIAA